MAMLRMAVALLTVTLVPTAIGAQRRNLNPDLLPFRLVMSAPVGFGTPLERATRDGYVCAAVARPVTPLLPNNVAVLMGRPVAGGPAPRMDVVVGRSGIIDDFHDDVNKAAAKGFRMCGLTWTTSVWGRTDLYTPVAVMTQLPAGTAPPQYRVIRLRPPSDQWKALEKAAAEGFALTHVMSRPEAPASDTSELIFVTEKTADTRPMRYELAFAGNAVALQKAVDTLAAGGYRVQGMWSANTRVSILMAKPVTGEWPEPAEYKLDDPSTLRIGSLDGTLLGMLRHRDGFMGVYSRKMPRLEYTVTEGMVVDQERRPYGAVVGNEIRFLERLEGDYERGYWPLEFTLHGGRGEELTATVISSRTPR